MQLTLFNHFTCNHANTLERKEPAGSVHHSRLVCQDCGSFIKWLPKSKSAHVSIARLLLHPDLEEWQKRFLKMIVYRAPTKSEEIVVKAIEAKLTS